MKRALAVLSVLAVLLATRTVWASSLLDISLRPMASGRAEYQMGDSIRFRSAIKNTSQQMASGLVAWVSLIQVDPGHEQPVDLEDWSAHKAIVIASLPPGNSETMDWPLRLIQAGRYRIMVSVAEKRAEMVFISRFIDFSVKQKPVIESRRILPVAIGMPLLVGLFMGWRLHRRA